MNIKRFALMGAAAMMLTATPALASLGVHAVDATNPCKKCHDTAKGSATLRGWAGAGLPNISGTAWAGRTISSLCYMCHTSGGGGFTATNQSANAYNTGSHGNTISNVPEGADDTADATAAASGMPYMTKTNMECTSCHNVHKYEDKPFIQRATVGILCAACHKGRVNSSPLRGTDNVVAARSTHPTNVAYSAVGNPHISLKTLGTAAPGVAVPYTTTGAYALGGHIVGGGTTGNFDCGTCHAVHGVAQGSAAVNDLLALNNTTGSSGSLLCITCHNGGVGTGNVGTQGNSTDHPIDDSTGTAFYPTGVAIPTEWVAGGVDRGPQPFFTTGVTGTPACSTCHDAHGGISGSALWQRGSVTTTNNYQTWCWVCHTAAQIAPKGHHSNQLNWASSQLVCGDCHGAAGSDNWTAHNGFWGFGAVSVSTTDSLLCEGCHTPTDPTFLVTAGLKGVAGSLTNSDTDMPSKHGVYRSANTTNDGQSSHQVDLAANATNTNLVHKTTAWASGGTSEWGTGTNNPICESCHNILVNGAGTATATTTSGWVANLLLEAYEDDGSGQGTGTGAYGVGDSLCRGCHTNGGDGFVHNPSAHTVAGYSFTSTDVPYGRATLAILTDETAACPDKTTADATNAPGATSYPNANQVNCDSCHRPHNADADSQDGNRYLILEVTGANAWGTTICAECHNTDTQCQ